MKALATIIYQDYLKARGKHPSANDLKEMLAYGGKIVDDDQAMKLLLHAWVQSLSNRKRD